MLRERSEDKNDKRVPDGTVIEILTTKRNKDEKEQQQHATDKNDKTLRPVLRICKAEMDAVLCK